jgi:hypothetical protein
MRLTCQLLKNFVSINAFELTDVLWGSEEQTNVFYVRLHNIDRNLRHISSELPADISLVASFTSVDGNQVYEVQGQLISADDKSLFSFTTTPEQVLASGAVKFTFTEGSNTYKFIVNQCLSFELLNTFGGC